MQFIKKALNAIIGASGNDNTVSVKHLHLPSKFLGREVKVDVFLPPHYDRYKKEFYPTIYFNDGQDMLALGMYDTLSRLYTEGALPHAIIVAIYCSDNRLNEYGTAHRPDYKNRGNAAHLYTQFVIEELLPLVRTDFRSRKEAGSTFFAGFSLGALSALDIVWAHPHIFGKVGVFSGSLWWRERDWQPDDPDGGRIMHDIVAQRPDRPALKFWFECGTKDEDSDRNNNGIIDSIDDTVDLIDILCSKGYRPHTDIRYVEVEGGEHNPHTWGKIMPNFLQWALID